ncbi:hypothetical protein [Clostridium mediterraneense]|nr:hypothetical protein [Clostridium mediterraneense]
MKCEYPREIFENLISIIREWLDKSDYLEGVYLDGFDENWWLFLRRKV